MDVCTCLPIVQLNVTMVDTCLRKMYLGKSERQYCSVTSMPGLEGRK